MSNTMSPVKWGVLGAARIADSAVIPGLVKSDWCTPYAIAARNIERAKAMADKHGAPKAYGSYDELLSDPEIEAVYIALPNHLHIEWAKKAADAGKHVLIEKPAAMRTEEFAAFEAIDPNLKISEAFMVRHQPRWTKLREILDSGKYGRTLSVSTTLSFKMVNTQDFREKPEWGGGAYYDLGCYTAMATRFVFNAEPKRVLVAMENHGTDVDRLSSVILDYGEGRLATFMVSISQGASQSLNIACENASIRLPNAYVPASDTSNTIHIDTALNLDQSALEIHEFPALDQYQAEVENFAKAIRGEDAPYFDIDDARANATISDAIFSSAKMGTWAAVT